MTTDTETLMLFRGVVASMPEGEQVKIREAIADIRALMVKHGEYANVAIGLVGAELAAEA